MTKARQPYRPNKPKTVSASVHMWQDCYDSVVAYAATFSPPLSISGAIHKLLRAHPQINLGDFNDTE